MKKVLFLMLCSLVLVTSCNEKSTEKETLKETPKEIEREVRKLPDFSFSDFEQYEAKSVLSTIDPWSKVTRDGSFIFSLFKDDRLIRKLIYEDGRILSYESYETDYYKTGYIYDDQFRIIELKDYFYSSGKWEPIENPSLKYIYEELPDGVVQKQYFKGNLDYTMQKKVLDDCILFSKDIGKNSIYEYRVFFDDFDRVSKIENTFYKDNQKADQSYIKEFSYDGKGNILSIINYCRNNYSIMKDGKIPWKNYGDFYEYDENGNVVKESFIRFNKETGEEKIESYDLYSDFDSYGYWRKVEHYYEGKLKETITREISVFNERD